MARRKAQEPQEGPALVDEEGDYYPPANALAAFLEGYGNEPQYDGVLVEVSAFLPGTDFFEVHATGPIHINGRRMHEVGEVLYAYSRELRPLNQATKKYIKIVTETRFELYSREVYDLRDKLALIRIMVKAESIAAWNGEQCARIDSYASACLNVIENGIGTVPPRPQELP